MTDTGLVLKKLAAIEGYLRDLKRVAPRSVETDIVAERFAEHTLQLAIQAVIDVSSHIVSDERLGDAPTGHVLFDLLVRNGWLPADLGPRLHAMAGFRNVLVHEYDRVDPSILRDVLENRTGDLLAFVSVIRPRCVAR